ncbi:MAG TPA: choice-of-anchor tandem repeat GloVer-containing protein [Terriglobales bacterium]|nr:choice-of-anchor tandem repeat GloVer-containing protein [Terriglobales bacterium]
MTNPLHSQFLISPIRVRATRFMTMIAVVLLSAGIATRSAQAQTYSVLYSFSVNQGVQPAGGLFRDAAGNLYGTTVYGGDSGNGTVFKLDTTGKETVLHSFTGNSDGGLPLAGLIRDNFDNFYGTTGPGFTNSGVVFKMDGPGNETVLHTFNDYKRGAGLTGVLVRDRVGNLYGATEYGGNLRPCLLSGCGLVFKLDARGNETVLYRFKGKADGKSPFGSLVRDSAGNLYGTTMKGGAADAGVVFKVDAAGKETVLYSFKGTSDGKTPMAGLIRDAAGNLYGTTEYGGASGAGVVFKLDTTGKQTVLYPFTGGADGANPIASLIRDAVGNLYGTAVHGGASGVGVVFSLDTTGKQTVLHSFDKTDGEFPSAPLFRDADGNLYGTAEGGGAFDGGVVFKLTP